MQISLKSFVTIFCVFVFSFIQAQQSTYQILDVNNFHLGLFAKGAIGLNAGDDLFHYAFAPAGSITSPLTAAYFWLTAKDNYGDTIGYKPFYYAGNDPQSGPAADSLFTPLQQMRYNDLFYGVWQITKEEIDYHKAHWFEVGYVASDAILDWPANGDSIVQTAAQLAPFADGNYNGIYEPLLGEYPVIKGDKCLFTFFNDYNSTLPDDEDNPWKTGNEVHMMMYAYNENAASVLGNTIFLNYKIIPRSETSILDTVFIGFFLHTKIGYALDNYRGSDSTLSLMYAYNGDLLDGPDTLAYKDMLPAFGVTSLSHPLYSAMFDLYDFGVTLPPYNVDEAYTYLQGYYKDGSHATYGGIGIGTGYPTNFIMSDRPDIPGGWSDVAMNNPGTDILGIAGIGPFSLKKGDTICVELALVFANDLSYTDNVSSVLLLYQMVAQLRALYAFNNTDECIRSFNDTTILNLNVPDIDPFLLYPNPANESVNVYTGSMQDETLQIELYNMAAQKVYAGSFEIAEPNSTITIPLSNLQSGVYAVVFYYHGSRSTELLVVY